MRGCADRAEEDKKHGSDWEFLVELHKVPSPGDSVNSTNGSSI